MKYLKFLIIILILNNCSFNTSSNMWKYNKNKEALLTNFDILDQNVDFEKYKSFILKNSVENEYPNLN
tara:strand:- start:179 stop:382 length:204 start_codon:yes stop_codon:yes gene_type:complete